MAIAKNFLKCAAAMALQLPLPFGPLRRLKQARPTTRLGRLVRAARAPIRRALLAIKAIYPEKRVFCKKPRGFDPGWWQVPFSFE